MLYVFIECLFTTGFLALRKGRPTEDLAKRLYKENGLEQLSKAEVEGLKPTFRQEGVPKFGCTYRKGSATHGGFPKPRDDQEPCLSQPEPPPGFIRGEPFGHKSGGRSVDGFESDTESFKFHPFFYREPV